MPNVATAKTQAPAIHGINRSRAYLPVSGRLPSHFKDVDVFPGQALNLVALGTPLAEIRRAGQLLDVLRQTDTVLVGYQTAAARIGWYGRALGVPMAQVCSRLDLAAFIAGLPLLAIHRVRQIDGAINPEAFGGNWAAYREEIETKATGFQWTSDAFDRLEIALSALPNRSVRSLWREVDEWERVAPGFIKFRLHYTVR